MCWQVNGFMIVRGDCLMVCVQVVEDGLGVGVGVEFGVGIYVLYVVQVFEYVQQFFDLQGDVVFNFDVVVCVEGDFGVVGDMVGGGYCIFYCVECVRVGDYID